MFKRILFVAVLICVARSQKQNNDDIQINENITDIPLRDFESPALQAYGGEEAIVAEFPWMALLQYDFNGEKSYQCAGSLISERYVLTAAHCATGRIISNRGNLTTVRLGEHDITKDIDCFEDECYSAPNDVEVEKIIVHENYNDHDKNRHHDIALVRLVKDVNFTSSISPISLSSHMDNHTLDVITEFTVAGWGRTLSTKQSNVIMKLQVPHYNHDECVEKYSTIQAKIIESQLCAGGVFKKDTCDGDSGGPLIGHFQGSRKLYGIVSVGKGCGLQGWPGLYTNVRSYENWIQDNIKS